MSHVIPRIIVNFIKLRKKLKKILKFYQRAALEISFDNTSPKFQINLRTEVPRSSPAKAFLARGCRMIPGYTG